MLKISVIIPALNPDNRLNKLIQDLNKTKSITKIVNNIIVVDDGSDKTHQSIFQQLESLPINNLKILHHEYNKGKGAALKTGFKYVESNTSEVSGIATMDSDGQHTVSALNSCLDKFCLNPNNLVIGVRHFTNEIPFRSQFGNVLTSHLVKILTHQNISDTQTGLRVIPTSYIGDLIKLPGNRFEFEFDMLLQAKKHDIKVVEQPIPTIYLDGNKSSHFRVIRDSIAIYARFLKFAASGFISFIVDIVLFYLVLFIIGNHILNSILIATIVSRVLSSIVNYSINHRIVFNNAGSKTFIKYGCLFVIQMFASGFLTDALTALLPASNGQLMPTIAKMIVDFALFIISYQIQRDFIFKEVPKHV
jgi:Glycosyltransferases involved in cell wall biogenesis